MDLFKDVVRDVEGFPKTEVGRIIANQIIRSVSSITANIAEGYGRRRGKEYEHYLYIARGSANETIDWYEKLKSLNYINEGIFREREQMCQELRAMLSKMINSVEGK
ncbi:MAG: four helix bundle protein [Nitrospirae bacterium]|nr:four helix bundle protein [Nitrospirota bacterium]